jgi:hypothetical protein
MSRMSLVINALNSEVRMESVQAFMEREDFEIDFREPHFCRTALFYAIEKKREDVALELIKRGANTNIPNAIGMRPLAVASITNLHSTAQALVQAGADVNSSVRFTPLSGAALSGHLKMARNLLLWGADPSRVDSDGNTARQNAKRSRHGKVVRLLDAWGNIQAVWVVRSAGQVKRLGAQSSLRFLPKDLCRGVGSMLVRL